MHPAHKHKHPHTAAEGSDELWLRTLHRVQRKHRLHTAGKLGAEDRKGSGMPSAEAPSVKSRLAGAGDSPVTKTKEQSTGKAGCQRSHSARKSAQLNPLTIQTWALPA